MAVTWKLDPQIEEARKHPGWCAFHRECGQLNFYINEIEKSGRGYRASAFYLKDRFAAPYVFYPLEQGVGRTVIAACLDAYRKAISSGHMRDTHLERLFEEEEDLIG